MPTYEYECQKCGHRFEEFQSITADPRKTCPKAECPRGGAKGRVKRLIGSGGGLLFKGSGFYETDYRSDGYQKAAKAESEGGKSGSDSKTDGGKAKTDGGKAKTAKAD
ncbi:MAG: FmdB family transcriptional regulator [Gemmatimonadetes bacterium]|mgnify:FL=1|jgi:putative FmdB family regulatory protein|nr:FmdB family transcriptional regulator [Gemmatimonadota bacterium]|tara:strand:- start:140 stop:463 length:324 start_codon:yes stop_codon:yes gene_type:complete